MSIVPKFTLRDSTNSTQIYLFPVVQNHNLPKSPRDSVVITSQRSKGGIVIDGGVKPFDAIINFILYDNSGSYEAIEALIDDLESKIPMNTAFYLRYEKTSSTYRDYKVKRIVDFDYPDVETDKRLYKQKCTATFLVNSW